MVLDAVSNFVRGNTDSDINSTSNTLSVKDASIFPDPSSDGEYNVVIWDVANHPRPDQDSSVEILRVTARDTTNNDLTVSRGQEATSASSHPSGSAVHLSPTAKMFGDIETTIGNFWDSGTQELTADVNNQLVDTDVLTINEQAARIYQTTDQSIPSSTTTELNFDASDNYSAGSVLTIELSNNRLAIEKSGIYVIDAAITYGNPETGSKIESFIVQDGTSEAVESVTPGSSNTTSAAVSAIIKVSNPPAAVRVDTYHNSSSSISTTGEEDRTRLDVARIG